MSGIGFEEFPESLVLASHYRVCAIVKPRWWQNSVDRLIGGSLARGVSRRSSVHANFPQTCSHDKHGEELRASVQGIVGVLIGFLAGLRQVDASTKHTVLALIQVEAVVDNTDGVLEPGAVEQISFALISDT